jgi:hypothetical protein
MPEVHGLHVRPRELAAKRSRLRWIRAEELISLYEAPMLREPPPLRRPSAGPADRRCPRLSRVRIWPCYPLRDHEDIDAI